MSEKTDMPSTAESLLRPTSLTDQSPRWVYIAVLIIITLAGAGLRAARLDHPMRGDESFNFLRFVTGDGPYKWLDYESPNNHLLHTLAEVVSTRLFGPGPMAIRLPALLAGVLLIPAGASLARRLTGRFSAGIIAAVLIASSSILIEYSINARGYSLVCLATVVMASFTVGILENFSQKSLWVGWALMGTIGLWAVPVMLYPIGILVFLIILQLLVSRPGSAKVKTVLLRLALALTAIGLASMLLYLPSMVISGPGAVFANRFVRALPVGQVLADLPGEVAKTISHWLRDTSLLGQVLVLVGLVGSALAFGRRRNTLYLLPIIAPLLLLFAAAAHRVVPFPRVWLFLLPLLLACAAVGLCEIVSRFGGTAPARQKIALAALFIAVVATGASSGFMCMKRQYLISEDPKTFVDAELIIDDTIALTDAKAAFIWNWNDPHWPPLAYYLAIKSKRTAGFVVYPRVQYSRVVIIVEPAGELGQVFESNPGPLERMGQIELLKRYPSGAKVYLADLRSPLEKD